MKIIGYKLYKVPPRWVFLKVTTDDGIEGWGEPIVEGKADTTIAAVKELLENLIGKDPCQIEDHWNMMYRGSFYRGGAILMSAIAGIDQALWDIKGKFFQTPVYELLGGKCRESISVYSWVGGDEPKVLINQIQEVRNKGFKTIKINGSSSLKFIDSFGEINAICERLGKIRDKFGFDIQIGIDFHGRVHKPMAKILIKELEQFKPLFIEEPLLSENLDGIMNLAKQTHIPLALGERLYSRWDFKNVLQSGAIDIIQPDVSHAGGITECRKIAAMAECYDVAIALHCPLGPIALAACLQVDAVAYNATIQEQSLGIHYNQGNELLDYLIDPGIFDFKEGQVYIPKGPGLGIEINEEYVQMMHMKGHNWHNPIWRHDDGSIAEW